MKYFPSYYAWRTEAILTAWFLRRNLDFRPLYNNIFINYYFTRLGGIPINIKIATRQNSFEVNHFIILNINIIIIGVGIYIYYNLSRTNLRV